MTLQVSIIVQKERKLLFYFEEHFNYIWLFFIAPNLDEKLAKLAPLIAKFEKVTLNGSQKMTAIGWEEIR